MVAPKISVPLIDPTRQITIGAATGDAIAAWMAELPLARPDKALAEIDRMLHDLNRSESDLAVLYRAAINLGPIIEQAAATLGAHYRHLEFPLTGKHERRAHRVIRVLAELANAFKRPVLLAESDEGLGEAILPEAVYCAIHYLARQAVEYYLLYQPVPAALWGEVNLLFHYAVKRRLHHLPLKSPIARGGTITDAYSRLLLLSCTNPYRLMRGETEKLYELAPQWCKQLLLLQAPEGWVPNGEFAIDLTARQAPQRVDRDWYFSQAADVLLIDLIDAKLAIARELALDAKTDCADAQTLSLRQYRESLKRFMDGLNPKIERSDPRIVDVWNVVIAVGLRDCHALYLKESGLLARAPKKKSLSEYTLSELSLIPIDDRELRILRAAEQATETSGSAIFRIDDPDLDVWDEKHLRTILTQQPDYEPQLHVVQQIDSSKEGLGLTFSALQGLRIHVGDLLCLRYDTGEDDRWRLGTVRWTRLAHDQEGGTLGVQVLAESVSPFFAVALQGTGQSGDESRGLLIGTATFAETGARLLLPATMFDIGTKLRITHRGGKTDVRLAGRIDGSDSFVCYAFELLPHELRSSVW